MIAEIMKSIKKGRSFTYSDLGDSDDFEKGDVIVIGTALVGIVMEEAAGATVRAASIAAGTVPKPALCEVMYEHEEVKIAKNESLKIDKGDLVFWDVNDENVNKTASDNYAIGVALKDAAEADTTVLIAFDGVVNLTT
jgi:hypothetical protein